MFDLLKKDRQKTKAMSLEDLILFGSVKDTVDVFGQSIVMQTLSAGFLRNVAVETSGLDVIARDYVWKIKVLARAIKSINGNQLLPENPDSTKREDVVEEIEKVLSKWELFVINEAYSKYEKLMDEQKKFADELRKKS